MTRIRVATAVAVMFTALAASVTSSAQQPINWLQGRWEGTCTRGAKTLPAGLSLDAGGGSLNRKDITGLKITNGAITFTEGAMSFSGRFSDDYSQLTGRLGLGRGDQAAACSMNRVGTDSDASGGSRDNKQRQKQPPLKSDCERKYRFHEDRMCYCYGICG
jgi:hypothetical protein